MINQYLTYPRKDSNHVLQIKKVCFCVDDLALNTEVNETILELIKLYRLNAVSCMTESPQWEVWEPKLLPYKSRIDIGLHFNLTHYFPATKHNQTLPLKQLMINADVC
jgi:predicted glycoside hydrolase/deacetylase ChbG (UPF0249 family)